MKTKCQPFKRKVLMSLRNKKNLVIVVGVVAALLVGTVLLGGYANIVPAKSDAGSQVMVCQAAGGKACCAVGDNLAACPKASGAEQTSKSCCGQPCTLGCPKPCCSGEGATSCCGTSCPFECPRPCCAGEAATSCCGMTEPSACCAGAANAATQ